MALPKKIEWVTFDVYGTLIGWETGAWEAFERESKKDGLELDRDQVVQLFLQYQREIKAGSYELYAEAPRRPALKIPGDVGGGLEPSRAGFLPASVERWRPFKETMPVLTKLKKKTRVGLISNIDDKLLGQTRRHIPLDYDIVVTAQQVRSYKPDLAHFTECERRSGGKKGWRHVAETHHYDVEPCQKKKIPVVWVNRRKEALESGQKKPDAEVPTLKEALKVLGF